MCGAVRHFSSTLYSSEGKVCPVSCMYFLQHCSVILKIYTVSFVSLRNKSILTCYAAYLCFSYMVHLNRHAIVHKGR